LSRSRPLVIAHRGNSSAAPENTLSAFRSALALGVDGVEFDYLHSADGVPVVFHDETLDRTTNACKLWQRTNIRLADCPLSELAKLDYGSWFGDDRAFANEPLPTVDAALDLICGVGALAVIERKSGDAETLINLLQRKGMSSRVVVMAFDWQFLGDCHRIDTSMRLVALGDGPLTGERLERIASTPCQIVGWDQKSLDSSVIAAIHERGWQAWTWTVDCPDRMCELLSDGVDAITSNVPACLLEQVRAQTEDLA
jgi:glycerophosphoryl diester phosphodiesterase